MDGHSFGFDRRWGRSGLDFGLNLYPYYLIDSFIFVKLAREFSSYPYFPFDSFSLVKLAHAYSSYPYYLFDSFSLVKLATRSLVDLL